MENSEGPILEMTNFEHPWFDNPFLHLLNNIMLSCLAVHAFPLFLD